MLTLTLTRPPPHSGRLAGVARTLYARKQLAKARQASTLIAAAVRGSLARKLAQ